MFSKKKEDEGGGDSKGLLGNIKGKIQDKVEPNNSMCPTLSFRTRMKCWFGCMILGCILSILSSSGFSAMLKGNVI